MVTIEKLGILLSPTERDFENYGVFNPGVYQDGNTVHLFYRAEEYGKLSTIGYAKMDGPTKIVERYDHPVLLPNLDLETKGIKDAKIVKIEDTFYITYAAYNGMNTIGALATSKDLLHFEKQGEITPNKNYVTYERLIVNCGKRLNPKYHYYFKIFNEILFTSLIKL